MPDNFNSFHFTGKEAEDMLLVKGNAEVWIQVCVTLEP
jgi:hypothetical protein